MDLNGYDIIGDFVDRGPGQKAVLDIVKPMDDAVNDVQRLAATSFVTASTKPHKHYDAIEILLKGPEIELPEGYSLHVWTIVWRKVVILPLIGGMVKMCWMDLNSYNNEKYMSDKMGAKSCVAHPWIAPETSKEIS